MITVYMMSFNLQKSLNQFVNSSIMLGHFQHGVFDNRSNLESRTEYRKKFFDGKSDEALPVEHQSNLLSDYYFLWVSLKNCLFSKTNTSAFVTIYSRPLNSFAFLSEKFNIRTKKCTKFQPLDFSIKVHFWISNLSSFELAQGYFEYLRIQFRFCQIKNDHIR